MRTNPTSRFFRLAFNTFSSIFLTFAAVAARAATTNQATVPEQTEASPLQPDSQPKPPSSGNAGRPKSPLAKIVRVKDCRASVALGQQTLSTPPSESFKVLRVYVKKEGKAHLDPIAVLEFDLPPRAQDEGATAVDQANASEFPYKVTDGALLRATPPNCDILQGKVAVDQDRDPFQRKSNAQIKQEPQTTAPIESQPPTQIVPEPTPEPTPESSTAKTTEPVRSESTPTVQTTTAPQQAEQPLWPMLELSLGFDLAQLQLVGLYIDSNIDTKLLLLGTAAEAALYPAQPFLKKSSAAASAAFRLFAIRYSFSSLDSARKIKVSRDGTIVGEQESVFGTQNLAVEYSYSYLSDKLQSGISFIALSRKNLRHSVLFNPGIEGGGASMRDLKVTCQGLEFMQGYSSLTQTRFPFALSASLRICLKSTAETPAITTADFPNSSTKFTGSNELSAALRARFPIDSSGTVSFATDFQMQRWVGSLALSDAQVIDSSTTLLGINLGVHVQL